MHVASQHRSPVPSRGHWPLSIKSSKSSTLPTIPSRSSSRMSVRYSAAEMGSRLQSDTSLNFYAQTFAYTLNNLKNIFDQTSKLEVKRVAAYECLAELSKVMRVLFEKYSLNKSKELLIDSRSLIATVKQYNYEVFSSERHGNVIDAINKLYSSFHASLSNYVMEDIATMTPVLTVPSTLPVGAESAKVATTASMSLNSASYSAGGGGGVPAEPPRLQQSILVNHVEMPEERLLTDPEGMNRALEQAKKWAKYAKDLIAYLEKRTQIEIEYHRSIIKNAHTLKSSIGDESFLPFQDIYAKFSGQEMDNANISLSNFDLLTQNFLAPLNEHRLDFEKKMKKIKEHWAREKKEVSEAKSTLAKARELHHKQTQEVQKLKDAFKASEPTGEWANREKIEKKRRTIEEATIREREAYEHYNKSLIAAHSMRVHMTKTQRDLILKTKDLLSILEVKIKEITMHYFETLKNSMTYSPTQMGKIIEETSKYEFGKSYSDYANSLPHSERRDCSNLDSSESDNNSPLQVHAEPQSGMLLPKRSLNNTNAINFGYDTFDREFNAITKDFDTCIDNISNDVNYGEKRKRLFGVPLTSLTSGAVPDIVRQCVEEIELNGAQLNGIYRVSGVKSKVEGLCHSFESNPQDVDLSNLSPNIIANVLKHFFRELPEPLLTFQLYPDFIFLAKKYATNSIEDRDDIIGNFKRLLVRMPPVHFNTLKYLMRHLRRISRNCAANNMPSSNLGIIFGPTLLRQNNNPNVTSSTLFDATHQGRVVELLIIYANEVFVMSDDDEEQESARLQSTSHNSFHREELHQMKEMSAFGKSSLQQQMGVGGQENFRLLKSATCSSIMSPPNSQSKANIVEARRQFFTSAFNAQQQGPFYKYKPFHVSPSASSNALSLVAGNKTYLAQAEDGLSPFSQLAASSNPASTYKIKTLTSANYRQASADMPSQIYSKNNELSKSSSSIYSMKNSLSLITSNEDIV